MPEISEERLAELEALEMVVKRFVLPRAKHAGTDAERERIWKYPLELTDEETQKLMRGHALWDDRPEGWTKKQLVLWSKGYLYGREIVGMNLSQEFHFIVQSLSNPAAFWKRQQLAYLSMCEGANCSCSPGGVYLLDEQRTGIECNQCHTFLTYDQVRQVEKQQAQQASTKRRGTAHTDHQARAV